MSRKVLFIDDKHRAYWMLEKALKRKGFEVYRADGIGDLDDIRRASPDAIVIVHRHPQHTAGTYVQTLNANLQQDYKFPPKIFIVAPKGTIENIPEVTRLYETNIDSVKALRKTANELFKDLTALVGGTQHEQGIQDPGLPEVQAARK